MDLRRHFRDMHQKSFVIPNPWDAGSARLFASLGYTALATTSSGFAATLGRRDGRVTRDEAIAHGDAIARATPLPVSADLEGGFGDAPEAVAETIALASATPLAGCSIEDWSGGPADLVPTHGDWQPRNWLVDDGTVRVIDFGRADLRPRQEDFLRLARQDFARDSRLEQAFLDGYGDDPREPAAWRRAQVAEAVATAVWSYGVGDTAFEQSGHRQLEGLYSTSKP